MDARAKPSICDLIVLFFLLSAMGYLAETMLFFLHFHALCERGFLSLPLLPIYGSSALLVYCLFGLPARGAKGFALYAAKAGLSVSAVEYAAGRAVHLLFGVRLWDYSYQPLHLGGYVSLGQTALWGVLCALCFRFAFVPLCDAVRTIPRSLRPSIAIALSAGAAADFLLRLFTGFV